MGTSELIIHHEIKQKLNKMKTGGSIGIENRKEYTNGTTTIQFENALKIRDYVWNQISRNR